LQVQRVNSTTDLSDKLVAALKDIFKKHRDLLPDDIRRSGVNKIYETLHHGAQDFNTDEPFPAEPDFWANGRRSSTGQILHP
jgi:hypothetical protein